MLKVNVEGEYKVSLGKITQVKNYKESFDFDEGLFNGKPSDVIESLVRSSIQNGLINDRLRKKNDNYKGYRTCSIVSIVTGEGVVADEDKELQALLAECANRNISIEALNARMTVSEKIKYLNQRIKTRNTIDKKEAEKKFKDNRG